MKPPATVQAKPPAIAPAAAAAIGSNSLIAAYAPFRELIEEMKKLNAEKVFNYDDPADNKAARSHIHRMRGTKGDINRVHDDEKKEVLEVGRRIDSQRNDLIAEIDALIKVHQDPIDAIEEREKARKQAIIDNLNKIPELSAKADPVAGAYDCATLKANLAALEAITLDEATFGESLPEATAQHGNAIIALRQHVADAERAEAEAAELERFRREAAERAEQERLERIRQEAAENARREEQAAAAKREAELREQAEKAEREKREAEDKAKRDREQAERDRQEAERRAEEERRSRELERQQAAEREARIARETEERIERERQEAEAQAQRDAEARERNRAHRGKINKAAVEALVEGGLKEAVAKTAITLIAQGKIPNVSIEY